MKRILSLLPLLGIWAITSSSQAQQLEPAKIRNQAQKTAKGPQSAKPAGRPVEADFVEELEHGEVNWSDQYIEAEGSSLLDTVRFRIKNQARLMAQRGAIVDAQRNLLEIVNGVLVEGNTSVKDLVVVSDKVETRVSGLLKGARQVGKPIVNDGVVTVRLRIPLYAKGLAQAVDTTPPPAPAPTPAVVEPGTPVDSLPQNIVIGVSGSYKPRLFPKLTDAQNQQIWALAESYDPTKGKGPSVVRQGMESYEKLKGKKGAALLEAVQDEAGNLKLTDKSSKRLEKWKKAGLLVWGIVKKLILPI